MQIMGKTLENLKHKWEKEWKKNGKRMEHVVNSQVRVSIQKLADLSYGLS